MNNDVMVQCDAVGKKFCRDLKRSLWYGVKDSATALFGRRQSIPSRGVDPLREGEFWANFDISFEIKRGDCLGLIGRNGAGKTTLLKMLNGLIKPDHGSIKVRGQVGALIALGAGFNPVLTGRENIAVNGSILGLSKQQISDAIEEIIDFAEIPHAIDSPVRNYSSGMSVRLGFAIATCIRPDVLIVDEVLAVGDAEFRLKCLKRMRNVLKDGCAVLLVSHSMTDIRNMASTTLWLQGGKCQAIGEPYKVVSEYLGTSCSDTAEIEWNDASTAPGGNSVSLRRVAVVPVDIDKPISISTGAKIQLVFDCHEIGLRLGFTLEVCTEEQIVVFHTGESLTPHGNSVHGQYVVDVIIPGFLLNSGKYQLSVTIDESQCIALVHLPNVVTFQVTHESLGVNHAQLPGVVAPRLSWKCHTNALEVT